MSIIIHLSDLHIGRGYNIHNSFVLFERIVHRYAEAEQPPIILITGDITDDGEAWQFQEAYNLLSAFRIKRWRVVLVPGNHNYGFNGIYQPLKQRERFHTHLHLELTEYPIMHPFHDCVILGLDSLAGEFTDANEWWADGTIGKEQRQYLNYMLDQVEPEKAVFVVLHHHPFHYAWLRALKDHAELKEVIKQRIQGLLFGHKHVERRLPEKEEKYGISVIHVSRKSTDIQVGTEEDYKDAPVFCFSEITVPSCETTYVEVPVKGL